MGFWKRNKRSGWLAGLLTGILCLGIGAALGQPGIIFKKAILICLECIGIG